MMPNCCSNHKKKKIKNKNEFKYTGTNFFHATKFLDVYRFFHQQFHHNYLK